MNKIAAILLIAIFAAACGSADADPVSLPGVWASVESDDAPTRMSAIIRDDEMEISIIDEDGTRMLYWLGTVPEDVTSGDIFVSEADVEALSTALLGSLDETKEFLFEDGELSFEQGLMGVTWTVTMRKVK